MGTGLHLRFVTNNRHHRDTEFFREVVRPLEEHQNWTLTETTCIDTAVERAASGALGELFYTHQPTLARLHLRIPDLGTPNGVLHAVLDQPLDPQLPQTGDLGTFTAALSTAHQAIAEKHATAYVVPKTDPHLILTVKVPVDYNPTVFDTTIEAIGVTANAIEELHCDIKHPIKTYLA